MRLGLESYMEHIILFSYYFYNKLPYNFLFCSLLPFGLFNVTYIVRFRSRWFKIDPFINNMFKKITSLHMKILPDF